MAQLLLTGTCNALVGWRTRTCKAQTPKQRRSRTISLGSSCRCQTYCRRCGSAIWEQEHARRRLCIQEMGARHVQQERSLPGGRSGCKSPPPRSPAFCDSFEGACDLRARLARTSEAQAAFERGGARAASQGFRRLAPGRSGHRLFKLCREAASMQTATAMPATVAALT